MSAYVRGQEIHWTRFEAYGTGHVHTPITLQIAFAVLG